MPIVFLATILFFFSYRLLVETLKVFGLARYDFWYHILLEYNWVYGTLIYFFVVSYTTPGFQLKPKHWIHFLPVTLEIIWSFYIKSLNFYWDGTRQSLSWLGYYGYIIWMHYPTGYIISSTLTIFYCSLAEHKLQTNFQSEEFELLPKKVQWIKRVILVLKIYSIIYVIIFLIDFFFFNFARNLFKGHPVAIGMAIITYWLGIEGFARRKDLSYKLKSKISASDKAKLKSIAQQLNQKMQQEKLFKNQNITLTSLAETLDIKPYQLTKCLNLIYKKKFNDYINELRIEEIKKLLEDPNQQKYTAPKYRL